MGIPSYFSYIIKNHPEILKKFLNTTFTVDYIFLDCNSIIYDIIKNVDISLLNSINKTSEINDNEINNNEIINKKNEAKNMISINKSIINKVYRPKLGIKLILEVYNPMHVIMIKYSLDLFISSCVQPKINLIGGGYIIIEKTEALIAIDVNSGSLSHLINLKNTILYTNYSATQEIINQITGSFISVIMGAS